MQDVVKVVRYGKEHMPQHDTIYLHIGYEHACHVQTYGSKHNLHDCKLAFGLASA